LKAPQARSLNYLEGAHTAYAHIRRWWSSDARKRRPACFSQAGQAFSRRL